MNKTKCEQQIVTAMFLDGRVQIRGYFGACGLGLIRWLMWYGKAEVKSSDCNKVKVAT